MLASAVLAARVLGVILFATALIGKLRNWTAFVGIIASYRLLWPAAAVPVALVVLAAEATIVVSFTTGFMLPAGAVLAVTLLIGFAAAMAINIARGRRDLDCGCFQDVLRQPLSGPLVVRNLGLAAMIAPAMLGVVSVTEPIVLVDGVLGGFAAGVMNLAVGALIALRAPAAAFRSRFA